jgi:hypothetical protein
VSHRYSFNFDASAATGAAFYDCGGSGGSAASADSSNPRAMSVAIWMALGNGCTAVNCRVVGGCDIGFALSGIGVSLIGCSCEVLNTAIRVGWSPAEGGSDVKATGVTILGFQTERCDCSLDLYDVEGCFISSPSFYSVIGTPNPANITSASWAGGTVTVTTTNPHNLPVETSRLQLIVSNTNYIDPAVLATGQNLIVATRTGASTFTYPLASNLGAWAGGQWNWPPSYGIRCRNVTETVISNLLLQVKAAVASFDLSYNDATVTQRNNHMMGVSTYTGGVSTNFGWLLPADVNKAGWRFTNLGLGSNCLTPLLGGSAPATSPTGHLNFSNLPGGAGGSNQDGPFEGQEFDIIDGQKSGGGAAIWNDIVSGGSSGHYRVRYDGTNWRRIG